MCTEGSKLNQRTSSSPTRDKCPTGPGQDAEHGDNLCVRHHKDDTRVRLLIGARQDPG